MHRCVLSLLLAIAGHPAFAGVNTFEGACGGTNFRVSVVHGDHPLENVYTLSVVSGQNSTVVHRSDVGGFFEAACLPAKSGKPLLVFQEFCGGSACIEAKYGAIDPTSKKFVLRPSEKNVSNIHQAESLLGQSVPYLPQLKGRLCCEP